MEEEKEFQFEVPINSKICPLCSSEVRLYYISFFTKLRMCTNNNCLYPFEENFKVYSSDDDGVYAGEEFPRMPRKRSTRSNRSARSGGKSRRGASTLGTNSNLSGSEWAELSTASQAYDSDDNASLSSSKLSTSKMTQHQLDKRVKIKEDEQLLKQKVDKIKEYNKVLFESKEDLGTIWNEKWISNLSSMQASSGMKLVREHELYKVKNNPNNVCLRDVKIDIESKEDTMSSIVIEIDNVI